jgi:negative regulator of sigma E activity
MNEDYLWDKSGQPDPEIQRLEEILGTLRYQPKRLVIPANLGVARRRRYFPLLAIAATVLLALLAAGVWLRARVDQKPQPQQAVITTPPTIEEKTSPRTAVVARDSRPLNISRNSKPRNRSSVLKEREREEALAAKEQLLFALRLASEKLNDAQRKTQGATPANQIKNQHRIG